MPLIESAVNSKLVLRFIPLPKKLFSLMPPPIVSPSVPKPADIEISPVGRSSTFKLIILKAEFEPSSISVLTFLKIPRLWISFTDLLNKISLKGSPSSIIKLFLITSSKVLKFPLILIFST